VRILLLTETAPFPLDTGGRVKTYHTLRALSAEHEVHCHAFIRDEAQRAYATELALCCHAVTLHLKRRSVPGEIRALAEACATATPFLVWRHFDRGVMAELRAVVSSTRFDAVYCDHLSMLEYGRRLGLPIVYDAHNVEFEIVRRHAQTLGRSPWRGAAAVEWRLLRRYERRWFRHCDLIYSVSEIDARQIRAMSRDAVPVAVVPIAVSAAHLPDAAVAGRGHELLFVGGMHWPPNVDAITYFVDGILPHIRQRIPDARLTVVGRPSASVRRLAQVDGVSFAGHVTDIEPYFQRSRVVVVPLRAGSGMRVKILDGLARGVPIVSTTIGCEGIDAVPGTHLLVADDPHAFAAAVVRVLTDDALAQALSDQGRDLAARRYDPAVVSKQTLAALNRQWRLCPSEGLSS
jgi:glycosyltransferase involved in cell wall biosynthesis